VQKRCVQCGWRGHVTADCPFPLFCQICESKFHVSHRCSLLKAVKPVTQTVGYGTPSLGFHYIPVSDKDYNDTKVTAAARALVTIRGGELTAEQV
jgi:hypothetical protein